jgi:uncharacterized LabA/DUF88 family protein
MTFPSFPQLSEPTIKRTVVFIDGQNLFHAAREAFGCTYPHFDITKLSAEICSKCGFELKQVHFYTGIPPKSDNMKWHTFWANKLRSARRQGVEVFTRILRARGKRITIPLSQLIPCLSADQVALQLPSTFEYTFKTFEEKGVDVRLALDVIRMAVKADYDIAVIVSQDQDLSEVSKELRSIARERKRWIKICSAFPYSPSMENPRGIDYTDWIRIERELYEKCIDYNKYFPKTGSEELPLYNSNE